MIKVQKPTGSYSLIYPRWIKTAEQKRKYEKMIKMEANKNGN